MSLPENYCFFCLTPIKPNTNTNGKRKRRKISAASSYSTSSIRQKLRNKKRDENTKSENEDTGRPRKNVFYALLKCLLHSCYDDEPKSVKQLGLVNKLLETLELSGDTASREKISDVGKVALICSSCEVKAEEIMKLDTLLEKVQLKLYERLETFKKNVLASSVYGEDEMAKKRMEEMEQWLQSQEETLKQGRFTSEVDEIVVKDKRKWLDSLIEFHNGVFEKVSLTEETTSCGYLRKCRLSPNGTLCGDQLSLELEVEKGCDLMSLVKIELDRGEDEDCFMLEDLELNLDYLEQTPDPEPVTIEANITKLQRGSRKRKKPKRLLDDETESKSAAGQDDISPAPLKKKAGGRKRKRRYKCLSCPTTKSNVFSFIQHLRTHETGERIFECEESICDDPKKYFSGKQLFDYHRKQHTNPTVFWSCKVCNKKVPPSTFQTHFRSHGTSEIYNCEHCYISCDSVKDFVAHCFLYHMAVSYRCLFCPEVFEKSTGVPARRMWAEHMYRKHGQHELLIKCEYADCSETFFLQTSLASHLNVHKERFVCPTCFMKFGNGAVLKKHIQVSHSKEKTFHCDVPNCTQVFLTRESLEKHRILEHHFPKYHCDQCSKEYATRGGLNLHKNKHHKGYSYPCDICDKSFNCRAALTKHKSTHGPRDVICEECGFATTSVFQLKKHLLIHSAVPKHACPHCPKRFNYTRALADHVRTHTGEKPFVCQYCSAAFAQKGAVQSHVRKLHEKSNSNPSSGGKSRKKTSISNSSNIKPPEQNQILIKQDNEVTVGTSPIQMESLNISIESDPEQSHQLTLHLPSDHGEGNEDGINSQSQIMEQFQMFVN